MTTTFRSEDPYYKCLYCGKEYDYIPWPSEAEGDSDRIYWYTTSEPCYKSRDGCVVERKYYP